MAAAMGRQAMRSSSQPPIQSTRLQYASIHQRQHVQPRVQYSPYYNTQTMNGLVPRGDLITNPNRSSGGVSYPSPNFSFSVICNGVNFNVGACGDRVHVVESNLIPYPNPVMPEPVPTTNPVMPQPVPATNPLMPQPVPTTNPGNVNMVTPSLGEIIAGSSRRVTVVDGSNGVGIGDANENEDLDLTLHL